MPRVVFASMETYRGALTEIIAAAYRVLETWEVGDLAGRVTALGETARHWDAALGLRVTGLLDDLDDPELDDLDDPELDDLDDPELDDLDDPEDDAGGA